MPQQKTDASSARKRSSSVVHYTTTEVVTAILNNVLTSEESDSAPNITLHMSHLNMMNDQREGYLITSKFFTESKRKQEQKLLWEKYLSENNPFVLSTCATDGSTQYSGSLPMWHRYADGGKGVGLRFDKNELIKHCRNKGLLFKHCNYDNSTDVAEKIVNLNKENRELSDDKAICERLLETAVFHKSHHWEYEQEWRILSTVSADNVKFKPTPRGIVEYIELKLPLTFIKGIMLGPLVDEEISGRSLNLLRDKLQQKYPGLELFTVTKSKIQIR